MPTLHDQFPGSAIGLGVDAGDEIVAPKHGQGEVAVAAFGGRGVTLKLIVEVEQLE